MTLYAKVTMHDGSAVIAPFEKLTGIRRLASDVMAGRKAFPVWRPMGTRHPQTGQEGVVVRSRAFINGRDIATMEEVRPIAGREDDHGFEPSAFESVAMVQSGPAGMWRGDRAALTSRFYAAATANDADTLGLVQDDVEYPIMREAGTQRRYIVLFADGSGNERRAWLDASPEAVRSLSIVDDEDRDDDAAEHYGAVDVEDGGEYDEDAAEDDWQ